MNRSDDEGTKLLLDLVATPSVSGQELAAVRVLAAWMAEHGLRSDIDAAGNAVGVLDGGPGPDGSRPRDIILLGHIDTVPGLVPVEIRDGRLYGRGSVDAKGPLAAFARAAVLAGPQPGWRIVVAGAVEEEAATSKGARQIAVDYPQPALAVIGEPSGWQRLTLGYKGRLLADVSVRQAMSHRSGGAATACESAVACWNRVTAAVAELNRGRSKAWEQVIPTLRRFESADDGLYETASLELGFRLPLHVAPEDLRRVLEELAGECEIAFSADETAYQAGKNNALVRAFLAGIRRQGGEPGFLLKTGTSDMNVVGPRWGCPILAYGPGDSRLDHTPEEHMDLDEWQRGVAVLAGVLRSLTAIPASV